MTGQIFNNPLDSGKLRFLLAAGGTGGHLSPALAVAEETLKIAPDAQCLFVGAGRPIEAEMIDKRGFKRVVIKVSGLNGRGILGKFKSLALLPLALIQALKIIKSFKPHFCLATGGYVCGPVGLAAKILGVPLIIHEQNALPGLTNRYLGKIANLICLGWPLNKGYFVDKQVLVVGNPIRQEIVNLVDKPKHLAEVPVILVVGGSQGARPLNRLVLEVLPKLMKKGYNFQVIHQTGALDATECERVYEENNIKAEVAAFFNDMGRVYTAASLGVMRAGALTLAEITALSLPAVLVPLPTAADNHQELNAQSLVQAGAAFLVKEDQNAESNLENILKDLLTNPLKLAAMSEAGFKAARLEAGKIMAQACLNLTKQFKEINPEQF